MTRDELKLALDSIYISADEIDDIEGRRAFLNGDTNIVDDITKEVYYQYLKIFLSGIRQFLKDNIEEPYVKETLQYMNKKEMDAAYGISFGPIIIENSLEVAFARYKPVEFIDYVEMVIYNPLLRIMHNLYKNALGIPYKMEYDEVFSD